MTKRPWKEQDPHREPPALLGQAPGFQREFRCVACATEWIAVDAKLPCPTCGGDGKWIDRVAEAMPKDQVTIVTHAPRDEHV